MRRPGQIQSRHGVRDSIQVDLGHVPDTTLEAVTATPALPSGVQIPTEVAVQALVIVGEAEEEQRDEKPGGYYSASNNLQEQLMHAAYHIETHVTITIVLLQFQ